ncbi:MAG: hypothetical protein K5657_08700 [Desulfovibrio sp.]|nr:hypothetical protein [Desulfovibrio sp.]
MPYTQDTGEDETHLVLKNPSADEQIRLKALNREKAWRDEMDRLDGAKGKGSKAHA